MGATLDGIVPDDGAVFEAKFMLPWNFAEDVAADKHMAQLQHNMLVTGSRRAYLSILYLHSHARTSAIFGDEFDGCFLERETNCAEVVERVALAALSQNLERSRGRDAKRAPIAPVTNLTKPGRPATEPA